MTATALLTGILLTAAVGAGASAYIWRVHRRQLETAAGLRILGGMRWRELARLVASGLESMGFQVDAQESGLAKGQQADMIVQREGRPWLVSCKQGRDYQVSSKTVDETQRALIFHNAVGGLIATPGRVSADALKASGDIQILHGRPLWDALSPFLPAGVLTEVTQQARAVSQRHLMLAWGFAIAVGALGGWAVSLPEQAGPQNIVPQPVAAPVLPRAPEPVAAPAPTEVPMSPEEQRSALARELMTLPGIGNAIWISESTLQVIVEDQSLLDDSPAICKVVERYENLRASRLQLQPAPGNKTPVRFRQCRAF